MKLRGSLLVIVCCLVIEFCNINQREYLLFEADLPTRILFFTALGLLFLLYPLVGHLTDVYLTRYRSLKWSFGFIILAAFLGAIYEGFVFSASSIWNNTIFQHYPIDDVIVILCLVYIVGLGLFQANAIQFGLDQLLEAPTPKLIAFIHWYYWAQNVGSLLFFYVKTGSDFILDEVDDLTNGSLSQFSKGSLHNTGILYLSIAMTVTAVLLKFCTTKKHFYIQKAGLNPFRNIYKVLKYSWKHKVPENRSAFTYWEEDIPRRIDLGKNKYHSPMSGCCHCSCVCLDTISTIQRTSCVLLLIIYNPLHMSTLVSVVGIPLYRLVTTKIKECSMLTKMWMGLYLSLIMVSHDSVYSTVMLLQNSTVMRGG